MAVPDEEENLEAIANEIRRDIVTMIYKAGDGHPGPALSIVDILVALYFSVMRVRPEEPRWADRDRLILSKGHACAALYATLAKKGYFSPTLLPTFRALNSKLQGHPDMNKTSGVDATSGSLGNGLSIGLGMALAGRMQRKDYSVFVITGDGELEEGVVWEAAMCARKYRASRLVCIVDHNHFQSSGAVDDISGLTPILPKWEAFGWHCQEVDGHDLKQLLGAIAAAKAHEGGPSLIVARTVKGKGVPFMEGNNAWHKRVPTTDEWNLALTALEVPAR